MTLHQCESLLQKPLHKQAKPQTGFTLIEAVMASTLLALGLSAAMHLSAEALASSQFNRNIDLANGLAQDLAECWQVQTPTCLAQFTHTGPLTPLSNDDTVKFIRIESISELSPNSANPITRSNDATGTAAVRVPLHPSSAQAPTLQTLQIEVSWPLGPTGRQNAQIIWRVRRANTPFWEGP
jgi:Tfp pilus assembly protein PilV